MFQDFTTLCSTHGHPTNLWHSFESACPQECFIWWNSTCSKWFSQRWQSNHPCDAMIDLKNTKFLAPWQLTDFCKWEFFRLRKCWQKQKDLRFLTLHSSSGCLCGLLCKGDSGCCIVQCEWIIAGTFSWTIVFVQTASIDGKASQCLLGRSLSCLWTTWKTTCFWGVCWICMFWKSIHHTRKLGEDSLDAGKGRKKQASKKDEDDFKEHMDNKHSVIQWLWRCNHAIGIEICKLCRKASKKLALNGVEGTNKNLPHLDEEKEGRKDVWGYFCCAESKAWHLWKEAQCAARRKRRCLITWWTNMATQSPAGLILTQRTVLTLLHWWESLTDQWLDLMTKCI